MQITWDRWAVPTITGDDDLDVVRGIGFAQAVAVGNDALELYGIARGTAAALWGSAFLGEDSFTARLGLVAKTDEWFAAQLPETLERLTAFCDGFNEACAEDERRGGDRRAVLPISPRDVVAHNLRVLVRFNQPDVEQLAFSPADFYGVEKIGSNSWAVSAKRSTTGGAIVMINPHLSWKLKYHRFVELRTISPGRDFHGCTLVGIPWQAMGYSPHVAWGHTVNPIRNLVVHEVDGLPVEVIEHTIDVLDAEPVVVEERRTVHGPVVVAPDGVEVAVRMAGVLDHPAYHTLESWWQLSLATSVEELFATHDRLWLPMFNMTAGDATGSVGALFCGTPPVRASWDDAKRRLPADDDPSFEVHPASAMPRVVDPESGWVQNCNETPYLYTLPALDESAFPPAIAPDPFDVVEMRPFVSLDWLQRHEAVSPEALSELKFSKRAVLADQVLDQLLDAAEVEDDLAPAVEALRAWDRNMGSDSKGYVLFFLWAALASPTLIVPHKMFVPRPRPGMMPTALLDPPAAAAILRPAMAMLGMLGIPLDASIGDVCTIGRDGDRMPANGGSGFVGGLKCLEALPGPNGIEVVVGDTWVSRVQLFADRPPVADSVLVYGNTTDPAAPPSEDQYRLWNEDRFRPRDARS